MWRRRLGLVVLRICRDWGMRHDLDTRSGWRRAILALLIALGAASGATLHAQAQAQVPSYDAQLAFEAAVVRYGGRAFENLTGNGCKDRLRSHGHIDTLGRRSAEALPGTSPMRCAVKYAPSLDEAPELPAILFFDDAPEDYYERRGTDMPSTKRRGVYLYRFDSGVLRQGSNGRYGIVPAGRDPVVVRASDVVSWGLIISNVERDAPHASIPFIETLITPDATAIYHCKVFRACDPVRVTGASYGLCDGRTKTFDGRGGLSTTSAKPHDPLRTKGCEAQAIVAGADRVETSFLRWKPLGQERSSVGSIGNSWTIEGSDPPGAYRIEVRISGQLVGALDFEVRR
jgi:hypothetical protein